MLGTMTKRNVEKVAEKVGHLRQGVLRLQLFCPSSYSLGLSSCHPPSRPLELRSQVEVRPVVVRLERRHGRHSPFFDLRENSTFGRLCIVVTGRNDHARIQYSSENTELSDVFLRRFSHRRFRPILSLRCVFGASGIHRCGRLFIFRCSCWSRIDQLNGVQALVSEQTTRENHPIDRLRKKWTNLAETQVAPRFKLSLRVRIKHPSGRSRWEVEQ